MPVLVEAESSMGWIWGLETLLVLVHCLMCVVYCILLLCPYTLYPPHQPHYSP